MCVLLYFLPQPSYICSQTYLPNLRHFTTLRSFSLTVKYPGFFDDFPNLTIAFPNFASLLMVDEDKSARCKKMLFWLRPHQLCFGRKPEQKFCRHEHAWASDHCQVHPILQTSEYILTKNFGPMIQLPLTGKRKILDLNLIWFPNILIYGGFAENNLFMVD